MVSVLPVSTNPSLPHPVPTYMCVCLSVSVCEWEEGCQQLAHTFCNFSCSGFIYRKVIGYLNKDEDANSGTLQIDLILFFLKGYLVWGLFFYLQYWRLESYFYPSCTTVMHCAAVWSHANCAKGQWPQWAANIIFFCIPDETTDPLQNWGSSLSLLSHLIKCFQPASDFESYASSSHIVSSEDSVSRGRDARKSHLVNNPWYHPLPKLESASFHRCHINWTN